MVVVRIVAEPIEWVMKTKYLILDQARFVKVLAVLIAEVHAGAWTGFLPFDLTVSIPYQHFTQFYCSIYILSSPYFYCNNLHCGEHTRTIYSEIVDLIHFIFQYFVDIQP